MIISSVPTDASRRINNQSDLTGDNLIEIIEKISLEGYLTSQLSYFEHRIDL